MKGVGAVRTPRIAKSRRRVPCPAMLAWLLLVPAAATTCVAAQATSAAPVEAIAPPRADPRARAAPSRPNVVIFLADDLNERLFDASAVLRRIAREGLRFDVTVPSPLCAPSRASILTGLHNHNHGIVANVRANQELWRTKHAGRVLPDWLRAAGYRTIFAGKFLNGCGRCLHRGWNVILPHQRDTASSRRGGYWLDELASRAAVAIASTPAEQPLFLLFAPRSPHAPFVPSRKYADRYDSSSSFIRKRLDWVPSFDEPDISDKRNPVVLSSPRFSAATIDRIVATRARRQEMMLSLEDAFLTVEAALRRARRLDETYVIFLSDNGFFEGEHRRPSGKGLPYEEAITVPMFVIGPDVRRGTSRELVYNHDVAATVAELANAATPPLDGRSFAPLWRGGAVSWRKRVLLQHYDEDRSLAFAGVRERALKAVTYRDGSGETYDLRSDPYELRSIDSASGFREASRPILDRLLSCAGEACWAAETAPLHDERP